MAGENDQFIDREHKSSIPAPPPEDSSLAEVTIRTMASDLALLGQTGGSTPQGETVQVAFARTKDAAGNIAVAQRATEVVRKMPVFVWIALAAAAAVVLFIIGFYILPDLFPQQADAPIREPDVTQRTGQGTLPADTSAVFLVHETFFKRNPAASLVVQLAPNGAEDTRKVFRDGFSSAAAQHKGVFVEILPKNIDGRAPSWIEFMENQDLGILSRGFFASRFEPDFTMFAHRKDSWSSSALGYVLKLLPGGTPLGLAADVRAIEKDMTALFSLFLHPPPSASGTVFRDMQFLAQPVRAAVFPNGAVFIYGWFYNQYLVMSTSEEGLREAVQRL